MKALRGFKMGMSRNPSFGLEVIDLATTSSVAHTGGTDTVSLTPPAGVIYEVVDMWLNIPAVGTAGTHEVLMGFIDLNAFHILLFGKSNFGSSITFTQRLIGTADSNKTPSANADQQNNSTRIFCSSDHTLDFKYTNNTDVNQTGNRDIKILVKKYPEA